VEATARFAELMRRPDAEIPLDHAAALIAAHAHVDVDVDAVLAQLDALATESAASDAAALADFLFVERGFAGNTVDYGDPRNSYLDDVLARRLGIPISLSVLMIETGRRRGLELHGVSMPGHFLVGAEPGVFVDPFHGGRRLDEAACRELFGRVRGSEVEFRSEYLEAAANSAIIERMLANLQHVLLRREPRSAAWVLRLRLRIPETSARERAALATLLGTLGRFQEAANELEAIVEELDGDDIERATRQIAALRARGN
jgi:regulator of sirC expression with transglutaminase-like and TPR domain